MKNYKANQHFKLDTKERQEAFNKWMRIEYPGYIDFDTDEVSAHNDGDFDWFVSEFLKSIRNKHLSNAGNTNLNPTEILILLLIILTILSL